MTLVNEIKNLIETSLDAGQDKFIIFPYGDIGMMVDEILEKAYGINATYIIDNRLSAYNPKIKELSHLECIDCKGYALILSSTNPNIYSELKDEASKYMEAENILELASMKSVLAEAREATETITGKYSYGPLCDHWLVERVGAFSSFAHGCDVVENHIMDCISTHPFMYYGKESNPAHIKSYDDSADSPWYFKGITPKGKATKLSKVSIGNDVWIGKNVIITNGANIGNGVIAGAGAIITKDVPDYAIVAGVPARVIRYRYTPEQVAALNRIQWWHWTDDQIRERHDDFYLSIEEFIKKHDKK